MGAAIVAYLARVDAGGSCKLTGSASESAGERKFVTLLFTDLAGYTALASALDPEDVASLIRPAMRSMREVAQEHGATVPFVEGDGFMAVFGVPRAHEDDAERAVRAAVRIRELLAELNVEDGGGRIPAAHSGVESGEVMVAASEDASGFSVLGDAVNMASRLSGLAAAGRIVVGERAKRLTEHAVEYGPRRLQRVKGKDAPIPTYEVRRLRAASGGRRRAAGGMFVDREAVLRRLERELDEVAAGGRSRVLVVTGEPGIGKSRLVDAFVPHARPRARILTGRCPPYGPRRPLSALGHAVGELLGASAGASGQRLDVAVRRLAERAAEGESRWAAAALVPGLRALLGSDGFAEEAVAAARAVLVAVARARPVVLVLDDLHWADPELQRFVAEMNASPWSAPVLCLGLARPDAAVGEAVTTMPLGPLEESHLAELVSASLGGGVDDELQRQLAHRSGGNPLFLEETVRMLIESRVLRRRGGAWQLEDAAWTERVPRTSRLLIAERLDVLPADEKRILQDASVAGEATWTRLAASLSGDAAEADLARLARRELLVRAASGRMPGDVEYRFKHALVRDVAYASLPRRRRAERHLDIAAWLRANSHSFSDEPIADIASHYEHAWRLLDADGRTRDRGIAADAARFLERWAAWAFGFEARQAHALYGRALEMAAEAGAHLPAADRARLGVGRAECLLELGRPSEAMSAGRAALQAARRARDERIVALSLLAIGRAESDAADFTSARRTLLRARARFRAMGDLAGEGWAVHRISETSAPTNYERELRELREAHSLFRRARDARGQHVVTQDLAYLLSTSGGAQFDRWLRRSRATVASTGGLRATAELERTRAYAAYYSGRSNESMGMAAAARPMAAESGDRFTEADALLIEALAAASAGRPGKALALADSVIALGAELGSRRVGAMGLLARARARVRCGDIGGATTALRAADARLSRPVRRTEVADASVVAAAMLLDRGHWSRVAAAAHRAEVEADRNGWASLSPVGPLVRGRSLLGAGRWAEAARALSVAARRARAVRAAGWLLLAELSLEQAALLRRRSPRTVDVGGAAAVGPEAEAIVAENAGLRVILDRGHEAAASFDVAILHWSELGATAWLARAMALRAHAERRAGGRRAGAAARRAERVLDSIGTPASSRSSVLSPLDGR
jgi:class 3 adenylate cyclase/tetratricopeptide (TPR) repeat protein